MGVFLDVPEIQYKSKLRGVIKQAPTSPGPPCNHIYQRSISEMQSQTENWEECRLIWDGYTALPFLRGSDEIHTWVEIGC